MSQPTSYPMCLVVSTVSIFLAIPSPARTQVLFFDDFGGPSINPAFQTSLPNGANLGDGTGSCTYLGAPNFAFQNVSGASVIRLSNSLSNQQRVGWSTSTVFVVPDFRYELRFNTLTISSATSIDNLMEAWIIDADNLNRFDFAMTVAWALGGARDFRSGGTIDNSYLAQQYPFQSNTWYRLVFTGAASQNVRASLFADDGVTELIGSTFGHSAATFPNGFRLGFSQAMGFPGGTFPVDVAVDYMRLTSSVPEPTSLLLTVMGGTTLALLARRLGETSAA